MNAPSQPPPDDDEPVSKEEFLDRLKTDPEFSAQLKQLYEAGLALPDGPGTGEIHRAARAGLEALKHCDGARQALQALNTARSLMQNPDDPGDYAFLTRVESLAAEAIDCLLDVREPERTRLMSQAIELRDGLRALKTRG